MKEKAPLSMNILPQHTRNATKRRSFWAKWNAKRKAKSVKPEKNIETRTA